MEEVGQPCGFRQERCHAPAGGVPGYAQTAQAMGGRKMSAGITVKRVRISHLIFTTTPLDKDKLSEV
jgi:hypothetical protein